MPSKTIYVKHRDLLLIEKATELAWQRRISLSELIAEALTYYMSSDISRRGDEDEKPSIRGR